MRFSGRPMKDTCPGGSHTRQGVQVTLSKGPVAKVATRSATTLWLGVASPTVNGVYPRKQRIFLALQWSQDRASRGSSRAAMLKMHRRVSSEVRRRFNTQRGEEFRRSDLDEPEPASELDRLPRAFEIRPQDFGLRLSPWIGKTQYYPGLGSTACASLCQSRLAVPLFPGGVEGQSHIKTES